MLEAAPKCQLGLTVICVTGGTIRPQLFFLDTLALETCGDWILELLLEVSEHEEQSPGQTRLNSCEATAAADFPRLPQEPHLSRLTAASCSALLSSTTTALLSIHSPSSSVSGSRFDLSPDILHAMHTTGRRTSLARKVCLRYPVDGCE